MSPSPDGLLHRHSRNTAGRDLIVGDIHGCFSRLRLSLMQIGFDPARDRLFSVGDLVDRGPESDQALDWLSHPWFFPVQGNHEDMAIRWGKPGSAMCHWTYMRNGGGWNVANTADVCAEISQAFAALPIAIELETANGLVGIVHAECPFDDWAALRSALIAPESNTKLKAVRQEVLWSRRRFEDSDTSEVRSVRAVVVGHKRVEQRTTLGNTVYIDTGAWRDGGDFTIIDAATLQPACEEIRT